MSTAHLDIAVSSAAAQRAVAAVEALCATGATGDTELAILAVRVAARLSADACNAARSVAVIAAAPRAEDAVRVSRRETASWLARRAAELTMGAVAFAQRPHDEGGYNSAACLAAQRAEVAAQLADGA